VNINWFDGLPANNHYVLEMHYENGYCAYLKSLDRDQIFKYWGLAHSVPEIVSVTIYQPEQWAKLAAA